MAFQAAESRRSKNLTRPPESVQFGMRFRPGNQAAPRRRVLKSSARADHSFSSTNRGPLASEMPVREGQNRSESASSPPVFPKSPSAGTLARQARTQIHFLKFTIKNRYLRGLDPELASSLHPRVRRGGILHLNARVIINRARSNRLQKQKKIRPSTQPHPASESILANLCFTNNRRHVGGPGMLSIPMGEQARVRPGCRRFAGSGEQRNPT